MAPLAKSLFCAASLAVLAPLVSGSAFLRSRLHGDLPEATREALERAMLAELSVDTAVLRGLEDELRPLYATLPKNKHGNLESSAVRYALHRHFVHKSGWYVVGLEPLGQAWANTTSPASAVKNRIPAFVESLFAQRLDGKGMGLHSLAVFAATLQDFVHNEALSDVMDIYAALELSTTKPVSKADVDRVVQAYVLQVLDGNLTVRSHDHVDEMEKDMREWFPMYEEFKMWVQDVQHTMSRDRHRQNLVADELSLGSVIEVVREVNDRLGDFQDMECRSLKAGLASMEYAGTGRVFLSDFYSAGLRGEFLFVEHVDWLRRLGALDESNPEHPQVIISNYLLGKANCLTQTNFHSVCCYDECQGLLAHLEGSIAAPAATVEQVAQLVSALPSDTVDAPRNLSAPLLSRLRQIADHHDGRVQLHGRLFAQWMHHAYPLECAFPHAAGTTSPITQDEWIDLTGAEDIMASEAERQRVASLARPVEEEDEFGELPWLHLEELVVEGAGEEVEEVLRGSLRNVMCVVAILSMAFSLTGVYAKGFAPDAAKTTKAAQYSI